MNKSQFVCTFAASLTCLPRPTSRMPGNTRSPPRLTWRSRETIKDRRSALHDLGRRWTSGCKARTLARTPVGDLRCPARRRRRHRWSACYAIKSIDLDPATHGLARGEEAYSIAMLLREEREGRYPALLFELSLLTDDRGPWFALRRTSISYSHDRVLSRSRTAMLRGGSAARPMLTVSR